MSETPWIPYGKTYGEFADAGLRRVGVQFRFKGGRPQLVGDMNTEGGCCNCCGDQEHEVVSEYRILLGADLG